MESKQITKEKVKKLMEIKGEARGVHFKNDADFVLKEKGKEGLKKLEKELKRLGCPIEYKKINQFNFYPIGLRAISLLAIKQTFDWPDEKIKELGSFAMKFSWVIKLLVGYFSSLEKTLREASNFWLKYFTVGQLEVEEKKIEEGYVILKIKNFNLDPIYCRCLEGVFAEIAKMTTKAKEVVCQEIECPFEKGKEHRFLIKWQ